MSLNSVFKSTNTNPYEMVKSLLNRLKRSRNDIPQSVLTLLFQRLSVFGSNLAPHVFINPHKSPNPNLNLRKVSMSDFISFLSPLLKISDLSYLYNIIVLWCYHITILLYHHLTWSYHACFFVLSYYLIITLYHPIIFL